MCLLSPVSQQVDDLYSLDTDLYRGIMKLKAIKQQGKDVADLDLTFETTTDDDIHGAQVRTQVVVWERWPSARI